MFQAIRQRAARFRDGDDGTIAFDAVLWMPLLLSVFVMVADTSIVFMNKARIERILQDGHRSMAVGRIADCATLETWIEGRAAHIAPSLVANCSATHTQTVTRIQAPVAEMDLTGATGLLANLTIRVESVHHAERGT